jgi:microcystin-dependent protein
MISEKNVTRGAIFALALGFVGLGYNQTRARADGIPGMLPLTYAGQLEEGGAAVNGSRNLRLTIWDDATSTESSRTRCITTAPGATVTSGRFQVVLDNACTAVVRATPDLWLEIEVNGSSLGRTKLSAVPFAIEANRASGLTPAAANALIPTGTIVAFGGNTDRVPAGWLPCDGRSVTRAMYPELFDALGTAHGGNGTNFNLPDYRGRFLRGVDGMAARDPGAAGRTAANMGGNNGNAVGSVEGFATGLPVTAFTTTAAGEHSHNFPTSSSDIFGGNPGLVLNNQGIPQAQVAANDDRRQTRNGGVHTHGLTGGDAETRPINAAVNFIIKI